MHRETPVLSAIDPCGRLLRKVAYHRRAPTDPAEPRITHQMFDPAGRVTRIRDPRLFLMAGRHSEVASQRMLYSLSGTPLLSDNNDAGCRLNLLAEAGHAVHHWDQEGHQRRLVYDDFLRPEQIFDQAHSEAECRTAWFIYADASPASAARNCCGKVIRHDDEAGTLHFREFGVSGTVLEQSRRFLSSPERPDWPSEENARDLLLEPQSATSKSALNAVGEPICLTDAKGNEQILRQTKAGELYETCLKMAGSGNPLTLLRDIQYNAAGQIEQQTNANALVTICCYEPADGGLIRLRTHAANTTPLQDLHYLYDPVGNPVRITDAAFGVQYFRNQRVAATSTYGYDTLGQLISATGRQKISALGGPQLPQFVSPPDANQMENYTQDFHYDAGGNLHTLLHHANSGSRTERTAVAALNNRSLPFVNDLPPTEEVIGQGYDRNGNLKALQRGQTLFWGTQNQLRRVDQVIREEAANDAEIYVYDGTGQRVRKIRSTVTSKRTLTHETRYLPGLEIRTSPKETLHVISVQAGRCRVQVLHWEQVRSADNPPDQHRYNLLDHLSSSTLELDGDGGLISQESYYPYGATAWWAGANRIQASYRTLRYSGQERDATGLYYFGRRYYIPWRQRWASADPVGIEDGLNLYGMVAGNPVRYVDLQGLSRWDTVKAAAGAGALNFTSQFIGATVEYGLTVAFGTLPPYQWLITGVGAASALVNGAIVGMAAAKDQETEETSSLKKYMGRTAGVIVGAGASVLPVLAGHFLNPVVNVDALLEIPKLAGNFSLEFSSQMFDGLLPGNAWKGTPPIRARYSERAATVLTLGSFRLLDAQLFNNPTLLSVNGAIQNVPFSAATRGAIGVANSLTRSYFSQDSTYKPAKGGALQLTPVKLIGDTATRTFVDFLSRVADRLLPSSGLGTLAQGVISFVAKAVPLVARMAYKGNINSGLQKLLKRSARSEKAPVSYGTFA
jgi:RHS repeat-associated protein